MNKIKPALLIIICLSVFVFSTETEAVYAEGEFPAVESLPPNPPDVPPPPPERRRMHREPDQRLSLADFPDSFGVEFGLASPLSKVSFSEIGGGSAPNGGTGILLGAQYLHSITARLGAGMDFEFFNRTARDELGLVPSADTSIYGSSLLFMGIFKYALTNRGRVRPYFLGGLGADHTSMYVDATPLGGFAWSDTQSGETRNLVNDSGWGLASTARLGLDFNFMAPATFNFELGWTGISNDRYGATPAGQNLGLTSLTGSLSAFTVAGKWAWRF